MTVDVSLAVEALAGTVVTRTRTAAGTWSHGRYTPGTATETEIRAVVEDLSGRARDALPEGLRSRDGRTVTTLEELRAPVQGDDGTPGDTLTIDGRVYEVVRVEPWTHHGGYYRATCVAREAA